MGTPREPVRLVGNPTQPMMIAERSGRDWTSAMTNFTRRRAAGLAHSERHYRRLGRLVAAGSRLVAGADFCCLWARFMNALAAHASSKKHSNVLEHLIGYFFQRTISSREPRTDRSDRRSPVVGAVDRTGHVDASLREKVSRRYLESDLSVAQSEATDAAQSCLTSAAHGALRKRSANSSIRNEPVVAPASRSNI